MIVQYDLIVLYRQDIILNEESGLKMDRIRRSRTLKRIRKIFSPSLKSPVDGCDIVEVFII